jgi:response regulator RpfG family c-di-GMP phosphodiesterase
VHLVCGVTDVENLAPIVDNGGVGLVLVVRGRASDTTEIARVLWHVSRSRRPMPVMVLAEAYDEAEALLCLQMGVADYLARADHRAWLGRLVATLVQPVRTAEYAAVEVGATADRSLANVSRVMVVSPIRV